jgi:hypothetical protein
MLGRPLKSAHVPPMVLQVAEENFSKNKTERIRKPPRDLDRSIVHL